jgi:integrase
VNFLPWYRHGKKLIALSEQDFTTAMETGRFVKQEHRAFIVLLYFTGIRRGEALRATPEMFKVTPDEIIFSVGKRLKNGIETQPLRMPLTMRYIDDLLSVIKETPPSAPVRC